MKLFEIVNPLELAYQDAERSFKRSGMSSQWSDYRRRDDVQRRGAVQPGVALDIRDWGHWILPPDVEDDGDYDWKVPTEQTSNMAKTIVAGLQQRHPKIDFELSGSEKNWLEVEMIVKV